MEIDELKSELENDYVMIKRKKWWSFLGGAFAFLIVAGLISYKSSLQALEGKAAKIATKAIQDLKTEAEKNTKNIKDKFDYSKELITGLDQKVNAIKGLFEKLEAIEIAINNGNPWEKFSDNIKDVLRDPYKYEYAILRNGTYFRKLTASTWNRGYRVMTEPFMTGDSEKFYLGGSLWIWDTPDPRDDSCVYQLYYLATNEGIVAKDGNGCTKADKGGEGPIYRRLRK